MSEPRTLEKILEQWNAKTLDELRYEASATASGFALDSIRVQDGPRTCMVLMFTDPSQIELLESLMDFDELTDRADWSKFTLSDLVARAARKGGTWYEDYQDGRGSRVALVFAATSPEGISNFEMLLSMIAGPVEDR